MSSRAPARTSEVGERDDARAEGGWLDSPVGPLFCWYHPPRGTPQRTAVLLCDAFGSERMNLHLTYRALAERCAAAGFAALRIDYAATCDSSGYPRSSAQVSLALASLEAGADFLRARSGTEALCAFGANLGGTLALALARKRSDVRALALWSPLTSGRAFVRACVALDALSPTNLGRKRPSDYEPGDHELIGYRLSAASYDELLRLDALSPPVEVAHALVLGDEIASQAVASALALQGTATTCVAVPPFDVDRLQATGTRAPEPVLAATLAFLARIDADERTARTSQHLAREPQLATSTTLRDPEGREVREELVRFGRDHGLVGILSRPLGESEPSACTLVFVSGGLNPRPGANRNYTEWARRLAGAGHRVLRMDVRGVGDSSVHDSALLGTTHRDETTRDLQDALDWLGQRFSIESAVCAGLCAGSYQALHAALADKRVSGIMLLSPRRLQRKGEPLTGDPTYALPVLNADVRHSSLSHYKKQALSRVTWQRLVRGQLDLGGISLSLVGQLARRTRGFGVTLIARVTGEQPRAATWLAGALLKLAQRGCNLLLVLDASDPAVVKIRAQLAVDRARLEASGRFAVELVEDTDHIFRPLFAQEQVYRSMQAALLAWGARPPPRRASSFPPSMPA